MTPCNHRYVLDEIAGERYCDVCGQVDAVPVLLNPAQSGFLGRDSGGEGVDGYGPLHRGTLAPLPLRVRSLDGKGQRIPTGDWWRLKVLAYMDQRGTHPAQVQAGFQPTQFESVGGKLGVPQPTSELAYAIYTRWRGDNPSVATCETMQASAFMVASRLHGIYLYPRTVCNVCGTKLRPFWRVFRSMARGQTEQARVQPEYVINAAAKKLGLRHEVRSLANEIMHRYEDTPEMRQCIPRVAAGGALYYACEQASVQITKNAVAAAIGCANISLRKAYRLIVELDEGVTAATVPLASSSVPDNRTTDK